MQLIPMMKNRTQPNQSSNLQAFQDRLPVNRQLQHHLEVYEQVHVRRLHGVETRYANSHVGSSESQTNIISGNATNIIGGQVQGKGIQIDAKELNIESLQDTATYKSKQQNIEGQATVGLGGASVSGSASKSNINANYASVNEQSGVFAGDGGYHVKADSVDLKGGAIVSTASKDKNDLSTNSLTFSNIENNSAYNATTVSLSGGYGSTKENATPTSNENWRDSKSFSPSLPQQEKGKDSTTTYATLSDGNLTIGGQATTTEALGIHNDAATAHQKVDTLPNLQEILDKQKTVADATSTIVAATRTYSQNQQQKAEAEKQASKIAALADLEAKGGADWETYKNGNPAIQQAVLEKNSTDYKAVSDQAQAWGIGGDKSRAVNAVTAAITGALGGQTDMQVAVNSLAPYAAQKIGEQWGHGADQNKAAQLAAHAILGAALAYVNGGNAGAGGSAAVAAESAADYLSNQYKDDPRYQNANGEFEANRLPEDVKAQIRDLTAAIGAVVGGSVGDSTFNAQIAGVIGQNAVENNFLNDRLVQRKIALIKKANGGKYSVVF